MKKKTLTLPKREKKTAVAAPVEDITFAFGDKEYRVTKSAIVRLNTGVVTMTPADISVNAEAQQYLVEHGCSCIEEVV